MLRLIEVKRIRMKKRGEKIDVFYRLVKKRIFFFFFFGVFGCVYKNALKIIFGCLAQPTFFINK